jgi:uncharacterized protein YndB with AHSA1/START domain
MTSSTDRIERQIILKASPARVWQAIANAEEFGNWFGVALKGQVFAPGQKTRGQITYPGYEHITFEILVEKVEPESLLSFRWHPYAIQQGVDYSQEEPTLVEFRLKPMDGGTLLNIVESGFDRIPVERRAEAFRMNSGGWDAQLQNIAKHVET